MNHPLSTHMSRPRIIEIPGTRNSLVMAERACSPKVYQVMNVYISRLRTIVPRRMGLVKPECHTVHIRNQPSLEFIVVSLRVRLTSARPF